MTTTPGPFGWDTLAPQDGGRRLMSSDKRHTVSAKLRTGGVAKGHLILDLYSEDAGWSILVLDEHFRPVTQAFAHRKSDAWEEVESELKRRALLGP